MSIFPIFIIDYKNNELSKKSLPAHTHTIYQEIGLFAKCVFVYKTNLHVKPFFLNYDTFISQDIMPDMIIFRSY